MTCTVEKSNLTEIVKYYYFPLYKRETNSKWKKNTYHVENKQTIIVHKVCTSTLIKEYVFGGSIKTGGFSLHKSNFLSLIIQTTLQIIGVSQWELFNSCLNSRLDKFL